MNDCGDDPVTRKLENEWTKLNTFYDDCDIKRKKAVTRCPGFSENFPNPVFVNYLESLELDFECSGFCKFWAKPIFTEASDSVGNRCSSALGHHVRQISATVGLPTVS